MNGQKRKRFELYLSAEENEQLRLVAEDNGLDKSVFLRALIRREWNASPHLHAQATVSKKASDSLVLT